MTTLHVSRELAFPETVVTATVVVYGGKGMGKTNFGSVLVEELAKARLRWCVLDPMGVWWGLRHSSDGKGPGVACVILGGAHGDIPIEPTGGAVVADLVIDEEANVIVDFSRHASGKMWSVGERIRFVTDYTLRLFERQGELVDGRRREPIMQVLDEAARYIPQTIPSGAVDLARCVGAWEQVCEEGRNIGLGVTFLTQRSARMNKSVSELADVMIAFRTIGPNSLAAIMDWLGEHVEKARIRELASAVRELDVGRALVVSPGWLRVEQVVEIRKRDTFDSSATPKPGQRAQRVSGPAARPDLAKYLERMTATIEHAKANDPKALRAEVAALRKQLSAAQHTAGATDPGAIAAAEQRGREAAMRDLRRAVARDLDRLAKPIDRARELAEAAEAAASDARAAFLVLDGTLDGRSAGPFGGTGSLARSVPSASPAASTTGTPTQVVSVQRPRAVRAATTSDDVSPAEARILSAIAELRQLGIDPVERAQVSFLAGYSTISGGTGGQTVANLVSRGLLTVPGTGRLALTPAGTAAVPEPDAILSLAELHRRALAKLDGGQRRIVEYLIAVHPLSQSRAEVAAATGYTTLSGGTGGQNVADLVTLRLVDIPAKGELRAGAILFPEGL